MEQIDGQALFPFLQHLHHAANFQWIQRQSAHLRKIECFRRTHRKYTFPMFLSRQPHSPIRFSEVCWKISASNRAFLQIKYVVLPSGDFINHWQLFLQDNRENN
jgi:hypothetical protein